MALVVGVGWGAACVGDDPVAQAPTDSGVVSSSSGGSSGGSSGAEDAAPADAAARVDYGVFLTRQSFPTNFAEGRAIADRRDFVNDLCRNAAEEAQLPNARDYRAVMATAPDEGESSVSLEDKQLKELQGFMSKLTDARWCAIADGKPDCNNPLAVIFASAQDFGTGVVNTLASDEYGTITAAKTVFYSGIFFYQGVPLLRTCAGWTFCGDAGDSGVLPEDAGTGIQKFHGAGSTQPQPNGRGSGYKWLSYGYEVNSEPVPQYCTDWQKLPLMCIEVPGS